MGFYFAKNFFLLSSQPGSNSAPWGHVEPDGHQLCEESVPEHHLSMRNIPVSFRHSCSRHTISEPFTALQSSPLSHSTCHSPIERAELRINHRIHGPEWAHPLPPAPTQLTSKGRRALSDLLEESRPRALSATRQEL